MFVLLVLIGGVTVLVWLVAQAAGGGWPQAPALKAGVRLGVVIGVIRLVILWTVILFLIDASDWRQTVGHIAFVADAVLELSIARKWLDQPAKWRLVLSLLVMATSLALGLVIAYMARRMQAFLDDDPRDISEPD